MGTVGPYIPPSTRTESPGQGGLVRARICAQKRLQGDLNQRWGTPQREVKALPFSGASSFSFSCFRFIPLEIKFRSLVFSIFFGVWGKEIVLRFLLLSFYLLFLLTLSSFIPLFPIKSHENAILSPKLD